LRRSDAKILEKSLKKPAAHISSMLGIDENSEEDSIIPMG
jgi:hypothetical protein